MKPIYFEKSLGLDIREESAAIGLLGKQLRVIDTLEFHFFKMRPLITNGQNDEGAENFFLDEINQFLENCDSMTRGYRLAWQAAARHRHA